MLYLGKLEYTFSGSLAATGTAVTTAAGCSKLNTRISCGFPSSRMVKSPRSRPATGPLLSVATTSTTTRRVVVLSTVADSYTGAGFCSLVGEAAGAWEGLVVASPDAPGVADCGFIPADRMTINTQPNNLGVAAITRLIQED